VAPASARSFLIFSNRATRAADDRRFDTSPLTSKQIHSCDQQGKAREMHGADWRAVGEPGDDRGKNESAGINRIKHGKRTAALKRRDEKHHHRNVANYAGEKARIEKVTRESVTGLFRSRFVIELPERAKKSSDDEKDGGERRSSHKLERK